MHRLASIIGTIVLSVSCGGAGGAGGDGFPPDYPGSEAARKRASAGGEPSGETHGDELQLVHQDAYSACFDGLFRADFERDTRLTAASIACSAGESTATATVTAEMVSVYDYGENGDLEDVVTEDITSDAYAEASHPEPDPGLSRVVERRARICCEIAASDRLEVRVDGAGGGSLTFVFDGT
jgi:hypothetical protein